MSGIGQRLERSEAGNQSCLDGTYFGTAVCRVTVAKRCILAMKGEHIMGHGIIAWIIIGALAGWITGKIMKGSGFGFVMDMVVGLIGALIGGFISSHLGLGGVGDHGLIISIAIAVLGAVILTFLLRLVTGNRAAEL